MNNKLFIYLFSILLIFGGIDTIIYPIPHKPITLFGINSIPKGGDVTQIKWELGIILIVFGLFLFYSEYKKVKVKVTKQKYTICPSCNETYNYEDLEDGLCPKCNIETKDLDGYYDDKKSD